MTPKQCRIIHRWGATPNDDWYQTVGEQLKLQGYQVDIPQMPNTDYPNLEQWVAHLQKLVPNPNENTVLIGHSIGVLTILHYINRLNTQQKVGNIVTVAGWFHLQNLEGPEEEKLAQSWIEVPLDFDKIKKSTFTIVSLFSDNDPYVPTSEEEHFKDKLGATTFLKHNKGHFTVKEDAQIIMQLVEA